MRKTISANNNGSSFKFGHQQQHYDPRYPIFTGSSPALHNSHGGPPPITTGAIYKRGLFNNDTTTTIIPLTQQRENNSPNAYYYSSTLNTPKKHDAPAAKNIEQYHTKTTTLRSNKEPSSDPDEQRRLIMDNRGGLGSRRQTAASAADVHAFSSAAAPGQCVVVASYNVEHLASFAVGKHFGLVSPADGIRKLKQMERNNAICPVSMVFTLHPDRIAVLEQNGTLVEEFPLLLVTEPTAHISSDPDDFFNNVLLFIVKEHELTTTTTAASRNNGIIPTEMHIFQCLGISAQAVAEDLHHYSRGHFHQVRGRARNGGDAAAPYKSAASYDNSSHQEEEDQFRDDDDDDGSVDGNDGAAKYSFEMDVNTLNRCFDDIERFVCRIQAAAIAQREVEFEQRNQSKKRGSKKDLRSSGAAQNGFAQLRAQIPSYVEFAEIFQKFKLCFNLLAKLREHIHEPSAPELLHFLFTPLMVILDACQWGLGQPQLAQQVYSPLLSLDACQLLRAYLFPKEVDVWRTLGKAWNTAPDDWPGPLPPPYRPVFLDGFAPYGYPTNPTAAAHQPTSAGGWDRPDNSSTRTFQSHPPMRYSHNSAGAAAGPAPIHRGTSAPPAQQRQADFSFNNNNNRRPQQQQQQPPQQHHHAPHAYSASTANLAASNFYGNNELERINREKERLELERRKVLDKERELLEQERRLREESARLDQERRKLHAESGERRSLAESDRPDFYRGVPSSLHASPGLDRRRSGSVQAFSAADGRHQQHQQQPATAVNSVGSGGSSATATTYAPMPGQESTTAHGLSPIEQISPRQTAFVKDMVRRGCKVVQVTYDRNACNAKELSVNRGEYLEVLNDARNWWECRNVHRRQGFVPHTILSLLSPAEDWERQGLTADRIPAATGTAGAGGWAPPASSSGSSTPDMIRQRRGPKGEFRYF